MRKGECVEWIGSGEAVEQVLQETGMNEEALSRLFDLRRPLPE